MYVSQNARIQIVVCVCIARRNAVNCLHTLLLGSRSTLVLYGSQIMVCVLANQSDELSDTTSESGSEPLTQEPPTVSLSMADAERRPYVICRPVFVNFSATPFDAPATLNPISETTMLPKSLSILPPSNLIAKENTYQKSLTGPITKHCRQVEDPEAKLEKRLVKIRRSHHRQHRPYKRMRCEQRIDESKTYADALPQAEIQVTAQTNSLMLTANHGQNATLENFKSTVGYNTHRTAVRQPDPVMHRPVPVRLTQQQLCDWSNLFFPPLSVEHTSRSYYSDQSAVI
ncbi:hypothetical protein L596_005947 [Steinernema carpocapsae]|uniref:Uncharacterized protein n=1 Tax=Steinernema carpocapsae TaxID=34508 RepID=A0A4U8V0W4_STECR|nr:hypothetical protein L596_005947 [Steinernema carpocapsae]